MSYTHHQIETRIGAAVNISAGTGAHLNPGYQPFIVRAVALVMTGGPTSTGAETITVVHRPDGHGEDDNEVVVATLSIPQGADVGQVFYADDMEVMVRPGESLAILSEGDSGSGSADILVFHQPAWDHPSNNDALVDAKQ